MQFAVHLACLFQKGAKHAANRQDFAAPNTITLSPFVQCATALNAGWMVEIEYSLAVETNFMTNQIQTQQSPETLIGKLATIQFKPTVRVLWKVEAVRNSYGNTELKLVQHPSPGPQYGSCWVRLSSVQLEPEQV